MRHGQLGEALGLCLQLGDQRLGLVTGLAALLGIVGRAGQQDVPGRHQRCAGIARTIALEVGVAGRLVGMRQRHLTLDQRAGGGLLLALARGRADPDIQRTDALLQQFADHQRLAGQEDGFLAGVRRVVLQLLGDCLGGDGDTIDLDPRPLLLAAGDQFQRGLILAFVVRGWSWLERLHTGLRRLGHHDLAGTTGAATTTVAATSASTTHVTPPRIRLAVGDATHLAGPG